MKILNAFSCLCRNGKLVLLLVLGLLLINTEVRSQSARGGVGMDETAISKSRAQEEAEAAVSLSAERITALLNQEPGLLLQVKRLLARKAFEQGRLLTPAELTDEALFRLLREDDEVRVLATREIESRNYIRAKPTREEIDREKREAVNASPRDRAELSSSARSGDTHQPGTQEDAYWSTHEAWPSSPLRPEQPWEWQYPPSQWLLPQGQKLQVPARQTQTIEVPENRDIYDDLGDRATQTQVEVPHVIAQRSAGLTSIRALTMRDRAGDRLSSKAAQGAALSLSANQPVESERNTNPGATLGPAAPPISELDHPVIDRRPIPYSDIPSLVDLYSQVSQRPAVIERFGASVFRTGPGNLERLPIDLPAGPEYVLGPGDGFFMMVPEAVALVLEASAIGQHGDILVLDMGNPVRVLDLARTLIRLSGKSDDEVEIQFTGLRAGEKLEEELFYSHEVAVPTPCTRIKRTHGSTRNWRELVHDLNGLRESLFLDGAAPVRASIKKIVPEYRPPTEFATVEPQPMAVAARAGD